MVVNKTANQNMVKVYQIFDVYKKGINVPETLMCEHLVQ